MMRCFIAHTIKFRDEAQNGMSRKEVIQFIVKLTGANEKKSENHFDWMIHKQHLPQLKNYGRVQTAQATTTKRACIHVEQQLRWHNVKELAKDAAREKKVAEANKRKSKKDKEQAEFESKKAEVYDQHSAEVSKGLAHVCSLRKKELQSLLKYYFEDKTPNQYKINHTELAMLVKNIIVRKENETNDRKEAGGVQEDKGSKREEEEDEHEEDGDGDGDKGGTISSMQDGVYGYIEQYYFIYVQ